MLFAASVPPFDYRTISDVILHIRYTARDGGDTLRDAATKKLADALKAMEVERGAAGLVRGFSGRHEFPDAWQAFAYWPDARPGHQVLALPITANRFPAFTTGRTLNITSVLVALIPASGIAYDDNDRVKLTVTPPGGAAQPLTLKVQNRAGRLPVDEVDLGAPVKVPAPGPGDPAPVPWKFELTDISDNLARTVNINGADVSRLDANKVYDVAVLYGYTI